MFIDEAFKLAQMTYGQTGRNPAVGCVIEKAGRIIGFGAHLREGTAHAEVQALNMAGDAHGAVLYCTLEPCSHYGRTPPCTEAIVNAGIKKVVFAARDTSLDNSGIRYMESHGIEVVHEERSNIDAFYAPFFQTKAAQRPFVTLKLAASVDGVLADDEGSSKWLTNEQSRTDVHLLRHRSQAVLVGRKTYMMDQPKLDARHVSSQQPAKVIITKSGELALHEHDMNSTQRIIVISSRPLSIQADVIVTDDFTPLNIGRLLYAEGIQHLMVEGGAATITQFIEHDYFDTVVLYLAPKILGGTHHHFYQKLDSRMADIKHLKLVSVEQFDEDVKLTYRKETSCLQASSKK